jgi:signal transduction histidine kinase/coenzyme F420-reducing hydrogenase delta subunit
MQKEFLRFFFSQTESKNWPDHVKKFIQSRKKDVYTHAWMKYGLLEAIGDEELSDEGFGIMHRFAKVFEQTYTRFLDLQKAEAQAREAEIQLALERVRARSMAMHQSSELNEIVAVVYEQLSQLGFDSSSYLIRTREEGKEAFNTWLSFKELSTLPKGYYLPKLNNPIHKRILKAWDNQEDYNVIEFGGEQKRKYDSLLFTKTSWKDFPQRAKKAIRSMDHAVICFSSFRHSGLQAIGTEPLPDDKAEILVRFAKVFEHTYARFLDVKKAEAQAREAEIQLALERVRARSIAMHRSDELADVVALMYAQIQNLGFKDWGCSIVLCDEEAQIMRYWVADVKMSHSPEFFNVPLTNKTVRKIWKLWKQGVPQFTIELLNKKKDEFTEYMLTETGHKNLPDEVKEGWRSAENVFFAYANIKYGLLEFSDVAPFAGENILVYQRFAKVFEQTYTRFLDLQKAEAQAREAQIEAALERVRAASMAMHKSEDLAKVITVLYKQLKALQIDFFQIYGSILYLEKGYQDVWMSPIEGILEEPFYYNSPTGPWENTTIKDWKEGKEFSYVSLQGTHAIQQFFSVMEEMTGAAYFNKVIKKHVYNFEKLESTEVNHKFGRFGLVQFVKATDEEKNILKRFAKVFEQTYTRFLDLQKAEAQAREALIEAALERVRTQAMAMNKSDDLLNISKVLYEELKMLGIDEIRNAMILIHDEKNDFFLDYDYSSIGGKITRIPTNGISLVEKYVKELKENEKSKVNFLELIVSGEELVSWKKARKATGQLDDPRLDSIETLYYYHYSIGIGNVSISTFSSLSNKKLQVLERFRNVFQLPYQRYHDIEIAVAQSEQARLNLIQIQTEKKRAEDALTILKATQTQLIQSEKLASLGELTAGIAHEIQNPLNFVNNFSEVNKELVDELQKELKAGKIDDAIEISYDIKANEEKINHHGKRADAIVKGMLQHSSSGSGKKEPTNINSLADEYLRLSYHGFRAKDKSFNATMKTNFDESIGAINIIPQDFGRVILNLINNAFYVVNEKSKQGIAGYEPMVEVRTKKEGNKVLVSVQDNGNGIPPKILDKIFQPFFTTKPTGQGTGLGLSLSYDIVKAHGGELKVETKEGEGSEFVIYIGT